MIDAFCELIASLNFPWLVCLFLGFSFPLFLPWKPNKTKGKQRKPKENHRIQPAPNQRKTKEIKGNRRKTKETEGNESKSKDTLWRMHVPVMLIKTKELHRWLSSPGTTPGPVLNGAKLPWRRSTEVVLDLNGGGPRHHGNFTHGWLGGFHGRLRPSKRNGQTCEMECDFKVNNKQRKVAGPAKSDRDLRLGGVHLMGVPRNHLPSGNFTVCELENGPVEIVDFPSYIAWWFSSSQNVNVYQAG